VLLLAAGFLLQLVFAVELHRGAAAVNEAVAVRLERRSGG
jgi:hypothetical protein